MQIKPLLTEFRRALPKLEQATRGDDPQEALALWRPWGERLQPLATALNGVTITRQDEQRKLKNVRQWARRLQYPFEERYLSGPPDEVMAWIRQSLTTIEEALQSLARVEERLVGYQAVEPTFKHGPFTIINRYGYQPSEYEEALAVFDRAAEKIQGAGFGEILYGVVYLLGRQAMRYAGIYHEKDDSIGLNVEARHRFDDVFTLVHELGHRHWHKALSGAQRTAYEYAYSSGGGIPLKARQDMWQALLKADLSPRRAVGYLDDRTLADLLPKYFKDRFSGRTQKDLLAAVNRGEVWVEKNFVVARAPYVFLGDRPQTVTVSDYAKTNVKEDYAETFAHYVLGMPIPDEVRRRFSIALG